MTKEQRSKLDEIANTLAGVRVDLNNLSDSFSEGDSKDIINRIYMGIDDQYESLEEFIDNY